MPRVGAYVLNYNNHDDTRECLESILAAGVGGLDAYLVDNGSTNDSSRRVAAALKVELLPTGSNLGYAGGMNFAMRHAKGKGYERCLLVSTDVVFPQGSLARLLACAEGGAPFAMLAPVQVRVEGGPVYSAGKRVSLATGEASQVTTVMGDVPYAVTAADGAAYLVEVEQVLDVGGFDERYFMYWEDVDLSLRLAECGVRVLLCPAARIVHKVSGTAGQDSPLQAYHSTRNRLLFLKAHAGAGQFLAANAYQMACATPVFLAHLLRTGQRPAFRAVIRGYVDGLVRPPVAVGGPGPGH
jgi:GT2 family glycosyltransferase